MSKLKPIAKRLAFLCLIAVVLLLFYKCPVKMIFGIPCPGCGMTRAFLSFVRLDFKKAFDYHPLFPIVFIELVYFVFRDLIPEKYKINEKVENTVLCATAILMIAVWIYRLFR